MNKLFKKIKEKIISVGVGTLVLMVIGLIGLILCAYIYQWNIFEKLTSPQAFLLYMIVAMVSIFVLTELWFKKLRQGDDDDEI